MLDEHEAAMDCPYEGSDFYSVGPEEVPEVDFDRLTKRLIHSIRQHNAVEPHHHPLPQRRRKWSSRQRVVCAIAIGSAVAAGIAVVYFMGGIDLGRNRRQSGSSMRLASVEPDGWARTTPLGIPAEAQQDVPGDALTRPEPLPLMTSNMDKVTMDAADVEPQSMSDPGVEHTLSYRVVEGDTLSNISQRFFRTKARWRDIWTANSDVLSDPNHLAPGQVLRIP